MEGGGGWYHPFFAHHPAGLSLPPKKRDSGNINVMTNAEIVDRCMGKRIGSKTDSFVRFSFDVVELLNRDSSTATEFITYPERSEKSSDTVPLSKLPTGIDNMIFVKRKEPPFANFIDCESFFEKTFLLHVRMCLDLFWPN